MPTSHPSEVPTTRTPRLSAGIARIGPFSRSNDQAREPLLVSTAYSLPSKSPKWARPDSSSGWLQTQFAAVNDHLPLPLPASTAWRRLPKLPTYTVPLSRRGDEDNDLLAEKRHCSLPVLASSE